MSNPLSPQQQAAIQSAVSDCLTRLSGQLKKKLPQPAIRFDLRGRAAGQYRLWPNAGQPRHELRFNAELLAQHFEVALSQVVPHEVAHHAVACLYPNRRLRPHGEQWQRMMALLGAPAEVTHRLSLEQVTVRRQQRWVYRCDCGEHQLSTTRHNRVLRGTRYFCRACGQALTASD